VGVLTSQAKRNLSDYSISQCSQLLSSISRLGLANRPLLNKVADRLITDPTSLTAISNQSLTNLMTAFARLGMSNPSVWENLANQVASRVSAATTDWNSTDLVATVFAYARANPAHVHNPLFSTVSRALLTRADLTFKEVSRFLIACRRVQYRDLDSLSHCAKCLRSDTENFPSKIETADLLELYTNMDKLGVDMLDVNTELIEIRGVSIPSQKSPTWFSPRRRESRDTRKSSDSLRKRKYSW